jgi:hypothetical protein
MSRGRRQGDKYYQGRRIVRASWQRISVLPAFQDQEGRFKVNQVDVGGKSSKSVAGGKTVLRAGSPYSEKAELLESVSFFKNLFRGTGHGTRFIFFPVHGSRFFFDAAFFSSSVHLFRQR